MTTPTQGNEPARRDWAAAWAAIQALPSEDRWDAVVREAMTVFMEVDKGYVRALELADGVSRTGDDDRRAEARVRLEQAAAMRDSARAVLQSAQTERDARLSRLSAEAASKHAGAMVTATWVLSGATIALVLTTIVLVFVTANSGS